MCDAFPRPPTVAHSAPRDGRHVVRHQLRRGHRPRARPPREAARALDTRRGARRVAFDRVPPLRLPRFGTWTDRFRPPRRFRAARSSARRARGGRGRRARARRARARARASREEEAPLHPRAGLDRFFLISYITVGHFIACCTKDAFALKLLSQVNVVVGAFFVLSGYVVAYTCTELGEYKASPRIKPAPQFVASRIMGFYPLYLLAQLASDGYLCTRITCTTAPSPPRGALITFTLTQAWFPAHAELWNAPTWFLSALALPPRRSPSRFPPSPAGATRPQDRHGRPHRRLPHRKDRVFYDTAGWFFMEGMMGPKTHPNWLLFNATRFSPFMAWWRSSLDAWRAE